MKKKLKSLIAVVTMFAVVVLLAVPVPAQAANKKPVKITVSTKAKTATVKKAKSNTYTVTLKADAKNVKLTVKDGKKDVTKSCKWKTSDKKIVTVKNNKLTAKKAGKCKITITYKGKKTTLNVTVASAKCDHDWKEYWAHLYAESTDPDVICICSCGKTFKTVEETDAHAMEVMMSSLGRSSMELKCGPHGTKVKGSEDMKAVDDEQFVSVSVDYIDYIECTKCHKRVTWTM